MKFVRFATAFAVISLATAVYANAVEKDGIGSWKGYTWGEYLEAWALL